MGTAEARVQLLPRHEWPDKSKVLVEGVKLDVWGKANGLDIEVRGAY